MFSPSWCLWLVCEYHLRESLHEEDFAKMALENLQLSLIWPKSLNFVINLGPEIVQNDPVICCKIAFLSCIFKLLNSFTDLFDQF